MCRAFVRLLTLCFTYVCLNYALLGASLSSSIRWRNSSAYCAQDFPPSWLSFFLVVGDFIYSRPIRRRQCCFLLRFLQSVKFTFHIQQLSTIDKWVRASWFGSVCFLNGLRFKRRRSHGYDVMLHINIVRFCICIVSVYFGTFNVFVQFHLGLGNLVGFFCIRWLCSLNLFDRSIAVHLIYLSSFMITHFVSYITIQSTIALVWTEFLFGLARF